MSRKVFTAIRRTPGLAVTIGKACGITREAVYMWGVQGKKEVPAKHVLKVSKLTNLSPHDIRPDLYPKSLVAHGVKK